MSRRLGMGPRNATALGLVLLLAVSGCGSVGSRENAAADVAAQFTRDVGSGDFEQACGLLVPATRQSLEQDAPCPKSLADASLPDAGAVRQAQVWGQAAMVSFATDTMFLATIDGKWRVRAAGCQPQPPGPYQCDVEAG
jgi:hypothetical protein